MNKLLTLIFTSICMVSAYSQENLKLSFDSEYFDLKDSINSNLSFEETVKEMESYCFNNNQRLYLVAGWIFKNIDFDLEKFNSMGIVNDYKTVFAQRKGTCGDYAVLFSEFCNRLNILNRPLT